MAGDSPAAKPVQSVQKKKKTGWADWLTFGFCHSISQPVRVYVVTHYTGALKISCAWIQVRTPALEQVSTAIPPYSVCQGNCSLLQAVPNWTIGVGAWERRPKALWRGQAPKLIHPFVSIRTLRLMNPVPYNSGNVAYYQNIISRS